jgi:endonuclease/exonuclease/phosphatase (EEP) superfamily protein YafD
MALDIARIIIYTLGYFIVTVSLIPLVRHDNWIFRIFEYPRAQKLFINVLLLILFILVADWSNRHAIVFTAILSANSLYLLYQVFPYTPVAKHQMQGQKQPEKDKHFKILVCNVYQDNRNANRCLDCIRKHDPDIIIMVEIDTWWDEQLSSLQKDYPYAVRKPLENTYGMLLYSKLELLNPQVKFVVEPDVPSIHTLVRLPCGDLFYLYCLHPQPPVPQENPRSKERDAEILTIAKEARKCHLPVVVAGDLNDVAWSYTTELFLKSSGLLDPRRGRGFFNTFHAHHWFLRWPLDHIFCSKHFQLNGLKRLPPVGSDHFPILVQLGLRKDDTEKNEEEQLVASSDEAEQAEQKIDKV